MSIVIASTPGSGPDCAAALRSRITFAIASTVAGAAGPGCCRPVSVCTNPRVAGASAAGAAAPPAPGESAPSSSTSAAWMSAAAEADPACADARAGGEGLRRKVGFTSGSTCRATRRAFSSW